MRLALIVTLIFSISFAVFSRFIQFEPEKDTFLFYILLTVIGSAASTIGVTALFVLVFMAVSTDATLQNEN